MKKIRVSEIADFINKPFEGQNFYISNVSTVNELNKKILNTFKLNSSKEELINQFDQLLIDSSVDKLYY